MKTERLPDAPPPVPNAVDAPARPELLAASDEAIAEAVEHADPMILRGLLYQLTGDPELKAMPIRRVTVGRSETVVPATDEDVAMLRRKAANFLKVYRDSGAGPIDHGPQDRLAESLALIVGQPIRAEALDLMIEESALNPWARSLTWQGRPDPERLANFSVLIIGAGMGGLNAAVQLKRAGIRYSVVEKNNGVGGTWHDNRYPGARVDTPSRAYTNLFGVDFPYVFPFGTRAENQKYYDWVADNFGVRDDIRFETEVRSLSWNEAAAMWEIAITDRDGDHILRANAVITAVGFLSRPNLPDIAGMDTFQGLSWHTARWPEDADLSGKRVAVVGTGCTGYQMVPELARKAEHVTVFQRTPQWLFPLPGYLAPTPDPLLWLDRNLPFHTNFMRFRAFYGAGPDFTKIFDIDPDFDDPHCVSAVNKAARDSAIAYLEKKLVDPELVAAMTPKHPVWSARPVLVDADDNILHALQRDNVTLVTQGIQRIEPTGIIAGDGSRHDVDVIVYATGFRADEFLYPMTITGRDGQTIEQLWAADGARAYLGCMMPGFPNLWTLYGPNTNGGLPVAQFHEMTTLYAMQCIEKLILDESKSVEVREDAYWRYNRRLDELNRTKVWADPRAHNYWWTKHGRTSSQIPFTGYEVRDLLLKPDLDDLDVQ
jgi:4-hydroxyacetophenone monooxygenase